MLSEKSWKLQSEYEVQNNEKKDNLLFFNSTSKHTKKKYEEKNFNFLFRRALTSET